MRRPRRHHLHQHAFAQAAIGDAQPLAREGAADRLQDGAAGEHQIGALGADAGVGDAALVAHGEQPLDHTADLAVAHPAAVDAAALVARQFEIDARDRGHRARRAEHVQAVDAAIRGGEAIDVGRDFLDHGRKQFAAHGHAAVALGKRHHADRDRGPGANLRVRRAIARGQRRAEQHQLGGAAADVEQDDALGMRIDQRRAAGGGEPRLGLAVDDFQLDADLGPHAVEEVDAVGRGPAGFGGDQARPGDAAIAHLGAADAQRLDRAHDRGLAQPARGGDALAQPDDARERVDDAEAVAGRARHQKPAVVGAEVERRIGRAGRIPPLRAVLARVPIGRPPPPARPPGAPVWRAVEAGRPDLVVHCMPFPAPKLLARTSSSTVPSSTARR
jgi:hypothetical protein